MQPRSSNSELAADAGGNTGNAAGAVGSPNNGRSSKNNSFDLLRLGAAMAVVVSHQCLVLGLPEPKVLGTESWGYFAVMVFFTLSGGLITQSWEREPVVKRFLLKRCLRIFPALVLVVCVTVFFVGTFFTTLGLREYFLNPATWKYFRCIILWPLHSSLPGVFESNPYPSAVNGPLWTLFPEFVLYLSVLLAGCLGIFRHRLLVSTLTLLLALLATAASYHHNSMVGYLSLLAFMFWWGAWLRCNFQSLEAASKTDLLLGLTALIIMGGLGAKSLAGIGLILLASGLVGLAAKIQFGQRITRRIGDLSYGVYIFAFPVQQSLVATMGKTGWPNWAFLTMTFAITLPLAFLSWHLVEKRFIRLKTSFAGRTAK